MRGSLLLQLLQLLLAYTHVRALELQVVENSPSGTEVGRIHESSTSNTNYRSALQYW